MNEVKNFKLGTILTMTTGYSCVDNFSKVWELVWFVCDNDTIGPKGLEAVKNDVRNHLFAIHPELRKVSYPKGSSILWFLLEQGEKFGSVLPVTKLGVKLPKEIEDSKDIVENDLISKKLIRTK